VLREFERQRLEIKKVLVTSRSRIHVSFDLWTSPSGKALIKVIFHYLSDDLKVCNLLIGIRRIKGSYNGENITEVIIPVI
jgi:hypothetical protein